MDSCLPQNTLMGRVAATLRETPYITCRDIAYKQNIDETGSILDPCHLYETTFGLKHMDVINAFTHGEKIYVGSIKTCRRASIPKITIVHEAAEDDGTLTYLR